MRKLINIEEVSEFPVYDISVADVHCFELKNTIIAHNSMFPKDIVSGGCVIKGTQIQTPFGLKNIEDIIENELVITLNGNKRTSYIWGPETLDEGVKNCFEIEFDDGYKVTCSYDHKFLIDGKWVEAKNLSVGDECQTITNGKTCKQIKKDENIPGEMRIKNIKSIGKREVYDISVEDAEHYVLKNGVVTHNTGAYYSASTIWIVGRQQDKDGNDLTGYNFIINIEKSRYTREKSKIPINVTFDGGIQKYSGLYELALEGGFINKVSAQLYQRTDPNTGEVFGDTYKLKAIKYNEKVFEELLSTPEFREFLEKRYSMG